MKTINILRYLFCFIILAGTISSCEGDFLDQKVQDKDNLETTFSDSLKTCNFVNAIYYGDERNGNIGLMGGNMAPASDEADGGTRFGWCLQLTNGAASSVGAANTEWVSVYQKLRRANIFLQNIERTPISAALKMRLKGEVHFLRAWCYYRLWQFWGGLPLVYDKVYRVDEKIEEPRATFASTVDYMISELHEAARLLPVDYRVTGTTDAGYTYIADTGQLGRATKGAALALKARILLMAASKLYNGGGNIAGATAEQIALISYPEYKKERWEDALAAIREIMKPEYGYALVDGKTNLEYPGYIWTLPQAGNKEMEGIFDPPSRRSEITSTNSPLLFPFQELADAFGTENGKAVGEDPLYNPDKPYEKRDPRFYYTILYNGAMRKDGKDNKFKPVYTFVSDSYTTDEENAGAKRDALYANYATTTGYYGMKMCNYEVVSNGSLVSSRSYPLMRYAEFVLGAAEALNEILPAPDEEVYGWLISIRRRAGIKPGTDGLYGLKANMTQDEMREAIYQERRVELALEGNHRYNDIRRWKEGTKYLSGFKHGIEWRKKTDGTFTSYSIEVRRYTFDERTYVWPIPRVEIVKMPQMIQNPGYN